LRNSAIGKGAESKWFRVWNTHPNRTEVVGDNRHGFNRNRTGSAPDTQRGKRNRQAGTPLPPPDPGAAETENHNSGKKEATTI